MSISSSIPSPGPSGIDIMPSLICNGSDNIGVLSRIEIVSILYSCGIRVSELINLNLTNIYLDEDMIKIFGKGNKERVVPIGRSAKNILVKYNSSFN